MHYFQSQGFGFNRRLFAPSRQCFAYLLFPLLLGLGMWAQREVAWACLMARRCFFSSLLEYTNHCNRGGLYDCINRRCFTIPTHTAPFQNEAGEGVNIAIKRALVIAPIVCSIGIQAIDEPKFMTNITMVIPILSAAAIYVICHRHRQGVRTSSFGPRSEQYFSSSSSF